MDPSSQKVSAIGLGTWQFGESGWGWGSELEYEEAQRIVHRALELGVNFVDTAEAYGRGRSEEILSEALQGRRQEVVVATKVAPPLGPGQVKRAAAQSLRRLGMNSLSRDCPDQTDSSNHVTLWDGSNYKRAA